MPCAEGKLRPRVKCSKIETSKGKTGAPRGRLAGDGSKPLKFLSFSRFKRKHPSPDSLIHCPNFSNKHHAQAQPAGDLIILLLNQFLPSYNFLSQSLQNHWKTTQKRSVTQKSETPPKQQDGTLFRNHETQTTENKMTSIP